MSKGNWLRRRKKRNQNDQNFIFALALGNWKSRKICIRNILLTSKKLWISLQDQTRLVSFLLLNEKNIAIKKFLVVNFLWLSRQIFKVDLIPLEKAIKLVELWIKWAFIIDLSPGDYWEIPSPLKGGLRDYFLKRAFWTFFKYFRNVRISYFALWTTWWSRIDIFFRCRPSSTCEETKFFTIIKLGKLSWMTKKEGIKFYSFCGLVRGYWIRKITKINA